MRALPSHTVSKISPTARGVVVRWRTVRKLAWGSGVTSSSAQQIVDRCVERFALDVPQRHINGSNRGHGDWTRAPVSAAIGILPDILGLKGIAANKAGDHVISEIAGDGEFAAVQRAITQA